MKIVEKDKYYSIEGVFLEQITAGFTKDSLEGNVLHDIKEIISPGKPGIAYMKQVHGSKINIVDESGEYEGDGIFSKEKGLILVVRTADCLPLLFYSPKLNMIGAVHMGWRSAREGILNNINFDLSSFTVFAGPSLRKCCYEVGEEFKGYDKIREYLEERSGKIYLDPIRFARESLHRKGLKKGSFIDAEICSFCSDARVFSYRKTHTTSRTLSFIVQTE